MQWDLLSLASWDGHTLQFNSIFMLKELWLCTTYVSTVSMLVLTVISLDEITVSSMII